MKRGSLDSLKFSTRCGCSAKARQMRDTADCERPSAWARERVDQWVASAGRSSSVLRTPSSTFSLLILRSAPGRGSSSRPSRRRRAKRARHLPTVCRVTPALPRSPGCSCPPRRPGRSGTAAPGPGRSCAGGTTAAATGSPRPTTPTGLWAGRKPCPSLSPSSPLPYVGEVATQDASSSRTRRGAAPTTAPRRSRRDPSACGRAGRSRPLRARGRGRSLRRSGRRSRPIARIRSGPVPRRRTPPRPSRTCARFARRWAGSRPPATASAPPLCTGSRGGGPGHHPAGAVHRGEDPLSSRWRTSTATSM